MNVADAYIWLNDESPSTADLLDQFFLREVHRRMFCNVWTWAGKLRQRETNIGVDPSQIQERWQVVLGDCLYWTEHETYPLVEIGVRFHHRMVAIHPFTNGNGRHARLSANKLAESLGSGGDLYKWGRTAEGVDKAARNAYLDALKEADQGDYSNLVGIAISGV